MEANNKEELNSGLTNRFCFSDLSIDEQEFLKHKKKQISYLKGENIFKQGAFAPYVIYILNGLVKVFLQTGYGKQINLRIAKPGDFLAFSSVFGEDIYTYSTIALTDIEICMIDKSGLRELLKRNTDFAMAVTSRNYQNEKHLIEIISNISYKQMRGKLASALLYLSSDDFEKENIFQFLSRQDLADFASIANESTIRYLKEFEKDKIIALDGKNIEILDKEKLEALSLRG
ncbi:MAG: Crp/Fnr family transcriptional regulator [Bacteroidales bacterium]|nr:Crp/Fnr family transcriptional regulator [Bacteroidales bacterium]